MSVHVETFDFFRSVEHSLITMLSRVFSRCLSAASALFNNDGEQSHRNPAGAPRRRSDTDREGERGTSLPLNATDDLLFKELQYSILQLLHVYHIKHSHICHAC